MLKWKDLLKESSDYLQDPMFKFSVTTNRRDHEGNQYTFYHDFEIKNYLVQTFYGERVVTEALEDTYNWDKDVFYHIWSQRLAAYVDNYKYVIQALIESSTMYYNPLWNVDGTEVVTEDRAKRQTDFTKGEQEDELTSGERVNTIDYGNKVAYTETMEYGLDETTHTNGAKDETNTKSTSPFNETAAFYPTEEDNYTTTEYDDVDSRAQHTDTATHNPHTDKTTADEVTDTNTYGERKDVTEQYAYKDTITTKRFGNIGVTKSTDLVMSYRDAAIEYWKPVLDLLMKSLSEGY